MGTRNERVVLSLEDAGFSTGMAKAAGMAALLDRNLDQLDGSTLDFDQSLVQTTKDVERSGAAFRKTAPEIDSFSGRLGLAARAIGALGPAAVPLTTSVVPAIFGLNAALTATALGAGVVVSAFQGVGTAMEALDKAQLEPTKENLEAARKAMEELSPAAREAVQAMQQWQPLLKEIRDGAAGGFFPGYVEGLEELESVAPLIEKIFTRVADASGDLFAEGAAAIAGPEGREFLRFVKREAPEALDTFGHAVFNVTSGVGDLIMAMDPLSDDFLSGLLDSTERFSARADGLKETEGYAAFIEYVRETGPQVVETISSLGNALLQIGEAAAPLGGPVLQGIEALADAIALIADSPLGTTILAAVSATSALSLVTRTFSATSAASWASAARGAQGYLAQISAVKTGLKAAGIGAAALGASFLAAESGISLTNTAMGAGVGMIAGPWGAALGAAAGSVFDLTAALNEANEAADNFEAALVSGDVSQIEAALEAKRKAIEEYEDGYGLKNLYDDIFSKPKQLDDGTFQETNPYLEQMLREQERAELALAKATEEQARALGFASQAERERISSMQALRDVMLGALDAELGWQQSLLSASKEVEENGRVVRANGQALRGHEQASIDSKRAVYDLIGAWNQQVRSGEATGKQMDQTKAAIRRMAAEMGLGKEQTRQLIRMMDRIKPTVKTKVEVATEAAMGKLNAFTRLYNGIHSKTVTLTTQYRYDGKPSGGGAALDDLLLGPMQGGALGSFVSAYAGGGFVPGERANAHLPEIALPRRNMVRVWAEPETQGESYIPHANDYRRPRAKRVLEKTAEKLGGEVQWFATGGIRVNPGRHRSTAGDRLEGAHAPGRDAPVNVRVFLGERELTDMVRTEVEDHATWSRRQGRR